MSELPSTKVNPNGLHQGYRVSKVSGEPIDPDATYFVLRLDSNGDDKIHINACREAARAYAYAVECTHLAVVGQRLKSLVNDLDHRSAGDTQQITFEQYLDQLDEIYRKQAAYEGSYTRDVGVDAWREQYDNGQSAEDAAYDDMSHWEAD